MNRIILVGAAASGKDHARKSFEEKGFKYAVSYTTRPPRPDEIHGRDYIFITPEECKKMVDNDEFYEHVDFNGWTYGTSKEQFYNDDVFIMTPSGLSHLSKEDRAHSFVIFFDIDQAIREERMLSRNMIGDSVQRRLDADRKDFENFSNYDLKVTNSDF